MFKIERRIVSLYLIACNTLQNTEGYLTSSGGMVKFKYSILENGATFCQSHGNAILHRQVQTKIMSGVPVLYLAGG